MINIPTNIVVFIVIELLWLAFVLTRSRENGGGYINFGSDFDIAFGLYGLGNVFFVPIWGGIFWW